RLGRGRRRRREVGGLVPLPGQQPGRAWLQPRPARRARCRPHRLTPWQDQLQWPSGGRANMPPAPVATCCKTEQVFLHERRIYSITHHRSHEEGCLVAARTVPVRLARLLCPDLTPCTKLVAV